MIKIEIFTNRYRVQKNISIFGICMMKKIFYYPDSKEWEIPRGMI